MRRTLPWVAGAALAVAASALFVVTPSEVDQHAAFTVTGSANETVTARTITAAVHDASFAERVSVEGSDWEAEGNWLVVTLVASAPQTEVDAVIGLATLEIDGQVFQASERPGTSIAHTKLHVGTDTVGALAFELPEGVRSGAGELRLAATFSTPRLDDLIVLPLTLDDAPSVESIAIEEPRLGTP